MSFELENIVDHMGYVVYVIYGNVCPNHSTKDSRLTYHYPVLNLKLCPYDCSDIRFMVGEERKIIYAHKCQLAARCEVFKAMFAVQKEEAQLESPPAPLVLSDIKPTIFLAVLEFIYTNCSSLSTEIVIDVLAASIEYGLDGLTKVK